MIAIITVLRSAFADIGSAAATHAGNILFTIGFGAIVTGVCLMDVAFGLIVAGLIICSLRVWDTVRTPSSNP